MQLAIKPIQSLEGIEFFKLMGTGGGFGFSLSPDFHTYSLFIVWKDIPSAKQYTQSEAYLHFNKNCKSNFTYWMGCVQSKGSWGGENPLQASFEYNDGEIMVLTRARVRWAKIWRFLRHTPAASRSLQNASGLIFTKGIGEIPVLEQATFSFWESMGHMEKYAYQKDHLNIVKKVKKEGWYREELFARFIPISLDKLGDG
ncbi:spheroidene monooxygenase [Pleomorphovibrio marinus]|uniref:spheroidene monooxygenase n=1 Tax=Pleomorphovibrio marinus TaxID=2164132 RepID=UPI001E5010B6|nr:spheroidene monooxygenase [Pleomorphovibrio marinus]